ncbi:hypothetical protein PSQ19_06460 [Devosia algicola]|uniref:ASCH domain-containing protein n=1 Tax=Devosia algicola TaxID=3026418 RepID=A0ABY7YQU1_9HYPH|nr:hypothetical protein [Devosia algicola]WDR03698.1 hypothetical protein PSQ19_06460 [Devosia algicola]
MLLKRELLEQIKAGKVDLVFRRWSRPSVKAGGTLKTKIGILAIRSMDEMSPHDVNDRDARRAGFADAEAFHRWLETMKAGEHFHRIEVAFLGDV